MSLVLNLVSGVSILLRERYISWPFSDGTAIDLDNRIRRRLCRQLVLVVVLSCFLAPFTGPSASGTWGQVRPWVSWVVSGHGSMVLGAALPARTWGLRVLRRVLVLVLSLASCRRLREVSDERFSPCPLYTQHSVGIAWVVNVTNEPKLHSGTFCYYI